MHAVPSASKTLLAEEEGFDLYRVQIEVMPGVPFAGLLFLQKGEGTRPLVLSVHGKEGTPEIAGSVLGETYNYNEMTMRLLRQGVHVFAPQLMLWNVEMYGAPYDRKAMDEQLRHLGGSMTALEVLCLKKSIDYVCALPQVDAQRIGMCGLSYGGFYTLLTMAMDTRIRAGISCARFADVDFDIHHIRVNGGVQEVWQDSAAHFTHVEMAMLCWPRMLCLSLAKDDPLIEFPMACKAWEELQRRTASQKGEWLRFVPFEGVHEFPPDDEEILRLVRELQK